MKIRHLPALLLPLLLIAGTASAQMHSFRARLLDTTGAAVPNGAVSLLLPTDSTMEAFGVSDAQGTVEIRGVKSGSYLLQVAGMGYAVSYRPVSVPLPGNEAGTIVLRRDERLLEEIEVKGVRIPVLMRGDTLEYNAGSFRVRDDAVTEELLKKLPGVQVDKAGNVRALGKDVGQVLVDGKEFFGNDPKMATKNLPADAIDKVQVFGNRSDAAKFSGIDDGIRNQTINLKLKKDRRKGYFGSVEAGGGTDARYQGSARVFRFDPAKQFAALGMLNNINRFGFSFQDYLSFQGGLQNLGSGGSTRLDSDMPVDFGQPVPGLITSGAGGLNYSADSKRGARTNFSYLGSGADKRLRTEELSQNFSPAGTFISRTDSRRSSMDLGRRINAGWRTLGDSLNQINLQGSARITGNKAARRVNSVTGTDGFPRNSLLSLVDESGNGHEISARAGYTRKTGSRALPIVQLSAEGRRERVAASNDWNNTAATYLLDTGIITDRQYQRNETEQLSWSAAAGATSRLRSGMFLEPKIGLRRDEEAILRTQGQRETGAATDSLSAGYHRIWTAVQPSLGYRWNAGNSQFNAGVEAELGVLRNGIRDQALRGRQYAFLKPTLFYQYAARQSTQLSLNYSTAVEQPAAVQMLPVTNYINPLQRVRGNEALRPAYVHTLSGNRVSFDQFSGTSLMMHFRGTVTQNKVSWARTIRADLSEDLQYINVADDYVGSVGAEYSMPWRKAGLELRVGLDETYNRGLSLVNSVRNVNTTLRHEGRFVAQTRKLKYVDIEAGISGDITQTRASVDATRERVFFHYNAYAQLLWKPHTRFNASLNGTLDRYTSSGFEDAVSVPLLHASASWYFLKANRGVLTLDAFDLMNRNRAVQRFSQLNMLLEQRSNIIRQYAMLSFKYPLSKTDGGTGIDVQVR